jgi:hypothetical protein
MAGPSILPRRGKAEAQPFPRKLARLVEEKQFLVVASFAGIGQGSHVMHSSAQ